MITNAIPNYLTPKINPTVYYTAWYKFYLESHKYYTPGLPYSRPGERRESVYRERVTAQ